MNIWTPKSQEKKGTYLFNGAFLATKKVADELPLQEILFLYQDVVIRAHIQGGIDYLQLYENQWGRRLFFIDQLNREMLESGEFEEDHHHCTLMFEEEY